MTLAETIINYIGTKLTANPAAIGLDTNLAQDGHLDSTAMLELILWVGDTFNVTVQSDDLTPENFATPRHIMEFVEQRRAAEATVRDNAAAGVGND